MTDNHSIEDMFNKNTPLGPIATPFDDLAKASHLHDLIFDPETFLSRQSRVLQPWVIVGRRGAGKTAFLYQRCFSGDYEYQIVIDSAHIFRTVCRSIENVLDISKNKHAPFVENVSNIWKAIFVTSAISIVCKDQRKNAHEVNDENIVSMVKYLDAMEIAGQPSPSVILNQLTLKALEIGIDLKMESDEDIEDILVNQLGVGDATLALKSFCEHYRRKIIILIDSVEHFPTDDFHMDVAASGLLHLLSHFRLTFSPINICFCIPSEIYNHFTRQISANPEKDFESKLMLQWNASELLKMSALRLDKYLSTLPGTAGRQARHLPNSSERDEIFDFWQALLPKQVTNNLGQREDSFAYILRHTQLLPRHVIGIFNQVIGPSLMRADDSFQVTEDDIVAGVRQAASSICAGVLSSYRQIHPAGTELCESMLPHMSNAFTMAEFRDFYRNYGRGIVANHYEALQVFKELGIFGIVVDESKVYYKGEFEYTQPGSMAVSENDTFCVHPAFAGVYRVGRDSNGYTSKKEVYPHGTDLDDNLAA